MNTPKPIYRSWKFLRAMFFCTAFRDIFVGVVLMSLGVSASIFIYWSLIDITPPLQHTSVYLMDEYGAKKATFRAGDSMVIKRTGCVLDEGTALYTRFMKSSDKQVQYFFQSDSLHLEKGCKTSYNKVIIPRYVQPGTYQYIVIVTFIKNPITQVNQTLPIPELEIVP